jgi:PAS domain S-box-containing protein
VTAPAPPRPATLSGWTLRRHLVLLALAVVLPPLVFGGSLVWRAAKDERERIEERLGGAARDLAASVDSELADILAAARVLAGSESLAARDLAAFHRRALEVQRELGANNVSLRDAESRQVLNTSVPWGSPLPAAARLASVDAIVAARGRPAFSGLYEGVATRVPSFAVVVPVAMRDGDGPDAPRFLSLAVSPARMQRVLEQEVTLDPAMVSAVVDGAKRFVARSRDPDQSVGQPSSARIPPPADGTRGGALRIPRLGDGEPLVVSYRWLELADWSVGVTIPESVLAGAERRALFWLSLGGLGAVGLGIGVALLVGRRLTSSVHALGTAAEALGRGDPVPAFATPLREANEAASALGAAAARLSRVQRIGRVGGFEIDLTSQVSRRSPEYLRLQGLPPDMPSWQHEDWLRRLHPEDRERADRVFWEAVGEGSTATSYAQEYRIVTPAGEVRWISARAEIERDPATGRALRMLGAHVDVTELKRAEQQARAAAERVALALDAGALAGTFVWDVPGNRLTGDERFARSVGLDPARCAEGVPLGAILPAIHPEDLPALQASFREALGRGGPHRHEYRVRGTDGAWRWVAASARVELGPDGRALRFPGILLDIQERREAEDAVRAAEARLRRVLDGLFAFVGLLTPEGTLLEVNAAPLKAAGLGREQVVGRPFWEAPWWTHEAGVVTQLRDAIARAAAGETVRYDVPIRVAQDGRLTIDFQVAPLRDEAGRITHLVPSGVPVEERVRAQRRLSELNEELERRVETRTRELAEAQARLAHAQRMEALGQLAGGIAHDFNNVLQAVGGGAAVLARRAGEPEQVQRLARMIAEAAERGSAVTRRLLAFSRRGDLRAEPVEPVSLLAELREVLAHTLGAGIRVEVLSPPDLPPLLADKGQLETVLINLATNARDAMDGQGTLLLAAAEEGAGAGHPAGLEPGDYVRLEVRDTGSGMDAETLARATEPFFTTKAPGRGTGLGLAMARGFAEQSGGALAIESAPGAGTAISIWLPVAPAAAAVGPADAHAEPRRHRILLTDDETVVRDLTAEALEEAGLRVTRAASGAEALALLEAGLDCDLLVSDLSMPGMDGLALIREAQRRRPGLPAILLTGFATNAAELAVGGATSGAFSLLRKPVAPAALADRISAMLESAAAT